MKKTGKFATKAELKHIKFLASAPMVMIGGLIPKSPQVEVHRLAMKHGLPDVSGYYGMDLKTGEFLTK